VGDNEFMSLPSALDLDTVLQQAAAALFPLEDLLPPIDVNARNAVGDTPLHAVLLQGNESAVRVLIRHGADVNAAGEMEETPLHVAARHGSADTIAALLRAGARVDLRSAFGQTAQAVAQEQGRGEVFRTGLALARRSVAK
jgi:ankyrin repeat protein